MQTARTARRLPPRLPTTSTRISAARCSLYGLCFPCIHGFGLICVWSCLCLVLALDRMLVVDGQRLGRAQGIRLMIIGESPTLGCVIHAAVVDDVPSLVRDRHLQDIHCSQIIFYTIAEYASVNFAFVIGSQLSRVTHGDGVLGSRPFEY